MFKKKSLKFTYEKVSRDLRHAEALRTRESSRFERLSMIRSINDSDFLEKDMEAPKEKEIKVPEKKKPSRLEMLFKWKQEKQIKKEMEKQAKKKPFYVGGKKDAIENKTLLSLKSSFTAQPNSSFNSSKFVKSKLITPTTTVQSSRILNSKQGTPSSSTQSARLPNSKQITPNITVQSSRILNSKQVISTQSVRLPNFKQITPNITVQSSRILNSKQTSLPKSVNNLCRSNSTATLSRKLPTAVVDKTGSLTKPGSSLSRSNSTAAISKKFPVPSSTISKVASSKAAIQREPFANKTPNNASTNANSIKSKNVVPKPVNKISMEQKTLSKHLEEKPVKKIGTGLPKVTSNVGAISRGISVHHKVQGSNINKKFGSNPKLNQKETSQNKENVSLTRGYCFRTAISNSIRQQTGTLLKTPIQGTPKKQLEKISKNLEEKSSMKEVSEKSMDNIPDVTFNSDISIIKPARTSFAPSNFTFQPPEGLNNFVFEDEDYDVYQDLEEVKLKFMSRTSTPSKDSGRKSSIQSSKDSLGSNNVIATVEKTSDISNSNDVHISELMSPESIHVKIDNKITNEVIDEPTCNETVCNINTNIGIKDAEADFATNQEVCKVLADVTVEEISKRMASISPVNVEIKAYETINQQNNKELPSDINRELKKTETTEQMVNSELQKNVCYEEHSLNDSDKTESPKEDAVEVNSNEKQFIQLSKTRSFDKTIEDKFLDDDDDDDSLLDSIDLNKIQLMKSDEDDTDGDDVASPQILKCSERKSNGAISKRVSMLKKLPIMKSIAESNETDECVSVNATKSSKKNQVFRSTRQQSKRLSNHLSFDILNNSPMKSNANSPNTTPRRSLRLMEHSDVSSNSPRKSNANSPNITPRRSLRIMKHSDVSNNFTVSPFQEKNACNAKSRHSVRLIDLSTPEKAACEKLLGENFENLDPNEFLIDFESPTIPAFPKSKKVSLLYSPEKRKSMRKSIRGDLISFSPV